MDYQDFVPITVLKVRDICCKKYQKKLKSKLLQIDGVYSVDINPEKSLVSVRGKVDPYLLLKAVSRTEIYAEIVCSDYNTTSSRNNRHYCPKENNVNGHNFEEEEKEEEHRCEDYVPPPINERMCRDYYCRTHRMRPSFRGSVPGNGYYSGHFPHRARGPTMYDPRWFMEAPPPPGYGYYSGRQMPGFGSHGSFGYENGGSCIMM